MCMSVFCLYVKMEKATRAYNETLGGPPFEPFGGESSHM